MNTARILAALDEEISRLHQVRALLAGDAAELPLKKKRGRPAKSATAVVAAKPAAKTNGRRRPLSDEARQRIAEAQKRRWAAQKKANQ